MLKPDSLKTYLLLGLLLLCQLLPAVAQQTAASGILTDEVSGKPVPAAAIYIANSTYNAVSDDAGRFSFERFPQLPVALTLSVIGYETVVLKVTADNVHDLRVALRRKVVQLDEVQVSLPERNGWKKYGAHFMEELVGWSDYAADCKLLNKEVVQFHFDKKEGVLRAWAEKPLQIRNQAMGYDIVYQLDDFELDMHQNRLFYKGYAYFKELPASGRKARQYRKNRKTAFNGSFRHFVQALCKGNTMAEGFEIRQLKRVYEDEAGSYIPQRTDTLSWQDKPRLIKLAKEIFDGDTVMAGKARAGLDTWRNDTAAPVTLWLKGQRRLKDRTMIPVYVFKKYDNVGNKYQVRYYETKDTAGIAAAENPELQEQLRNRRPGAWKKRQLLNLLYKTPINADHIITRQAGEVLMQFPDLLQVTYTREVEELPYRQRNMDLARDPDQQVSVFSLRDGNSLHLLEDGNFYDAYDLLLEQYWAYEKLDKLLPLDYVPPAD